MNIITRNNLNELADMLIDEIKNNHNPFESYTVIFPNLLTEQWFKSYWLKKTDKVLMNVKFTRLLPFIKDAYGQNNANILSQDERTLLIADIFNKNSSFYSEINKYYDHNTVNLYDLSEHLSNLFSSYELNKITIDGENENSKWENRLYNELNNNSKYTAISEIIKGTPLSNSKVFVFGFVDIEPLYMDALERLSDCTVYKQEINEENVKQVDKVISIASIEREIEYIHGEICKILDSNNNSKMYDILVYCPDVNEYERAIKKVFSNRGDKNFPNVPYVIINNKSDLSNSGDAISLLYNILVKNQFTRNDLYKLLSNSNIQKCRSIDPIKINDIIAELDKMNVYRNNEKCDEWLYGIRRLLVSKLIGISISNDNSIMVDNEMYYPYGSISMDNETIEVLASIVDDITEFRKLDINKLTYIDLKNELDKWLSYSSGDNAEENYYYNASLKVLDFLTENNIILPIDIVFNSMINAAKNIAVTPSNMLTGGVTFLDFSEKNIISSDYMFFVGMSSVNLPHKYVKDSLDVRDETNIFTITEEDKRTFKLLRQNTNHEYFSFVNIDLKTLEDYSPSTLYSDILTGKIDESDTIGLSEKRKYEELYSKSEFDKKSYNDGLTKDIVINPKCDIEPPDTITDIKYKDLAELINEGLMAHMNRLFKEYDDSMENQSKAYEPLKANNIVDSSIKKDILRQMIISGSSILSDDEIDILKKKYNDLHRIPYLADINDEIGKAQEYFCGLKPDSELKSPFGLLINNEWTLHITDEYIFKEEKEPNNVLYFYEFNPKKYDEKIYSYFSRAYIISLAYLTKYYNDSDKEFSIILNGKDSTMFEATPSKALEILKELYKRYNDFSNVILSPLDDILKEYDKIIGNLSDEAWRFFQDRGLVDIEENAGYTRNNFIDKMKEYHNFIKENILYTHFTTDEEEKTNE